ncbi:MAG: hypothetical protein ACXWZ4_12495 [Gemmatirosa sp.]
MRLARSVLAVALSPIAATLVACSGDDPEFGEAAGFYALTRVNGEQPPVVVPTPQGSISFTRGTMQLHDDGRFAMAVEQSFPGGSRSPAYVFMSGRYGLRANDTTMTVTLEQPSPEVLPASLSGKRATVTALGARLVFERP